MDETTIRERLNWVNKPLVIERIQEPPADTGLKRAVEVLRAASILTFDAPEGTDLAHPQPTIRFQGSRSEGFRAMAVALQGGLNVTSLRRVWPVQEGEPLGPWWEMTFAADQAELTSPAPVKEIALQPRA